MKSQGQRQNPLRYMPQLDGLRAVAILLVVAFHAGIPGFSGGFLGVDLFFVLSGFLITSLLLTEYDRAGQLDVYRFFARRSLRLYPALILLVFLYLLVAPFAWPSYDYHLRDGVVSLLYLSDYGYAFEIPHILRHTWSLAVEFHFYLLWPFLLGFLLRRFSLGGVLFAVVLLYVAVLAVRVLSIHAFNASWIEVYARFDTRVGGLLCGAALALFLVLWPRCSLSPLYMFVPVCVLSGLVWSVPWGELFFFDFGLAVAEVSAVFLLWGVLSGYASFLEGRFWVWLGKLSYGVYLFHYPVVRYFRTTMDWPALFLVSLLAGGALAVLSYFTIERFANRFKAADSKPAVA